MVEIKEQDVDTPLSSAPQDSEPQTTALFDCHVRAGAKIVDFSGWKMPLHYGSQMDEHHACRDSAVMFDVSHMTVLDFNGVDPASGATREFLQTLLANNIDKAANPGDAVYTCMLDQSGGIIDDLIAYWIEDDRFRLIVNAGTRDKDLAWINQHLPPSVQLQLRSDLALLAVQGPKAIGIVEKLLADKLHDLTSMKRFSACMSGEWFVARTGYTGEDGVEIALPAVEAEALWNDLLAAGVKPAGLGARDTLRLEAAMNLYGNDMDESVSPLESGIAWTVGWEPAARDFIGRQALEAQKQAGVKQRLVGLILDGRGVLRRGQTLHVDGSDDVVGTVTSGTFSPSLQKSIALARVFIDKAGASKVSELVDQSCTVNIRDKPVAAHFVSLPFVKKT